MSFGVVVGFIIIASLLVKAMKKGGDVFYADELVEPFLNYLAIAKQDERYEELPIIESIINSLKQNTLPDTVNSYVIKKDLYVYTSDEEGRNAFKIGRKYIVVGRKSNNLTKKL